MGFFFFFCICILYRNFGCFCGFQLLGGFLSNLGNPCWARMARLFAYIPRGCLWCAFGTLSPTARPSRVLLTPWGFAPHPTFATWQGCRRRLRLNTCTPTTDRWVASDQSRPWPLRGCCASLDSSPAPFVLTGFLGWGRFRKRNLKHAKECSIQQRRGFACGVCRWKRRFGCSRNSAVSAARFESGFRERDGQGQHWRGPHSHGGFLKMIVCESGGHANGLTYFIFRFLRRPQVLRNSYLRFCESQI